MKASVERVRAACARYAAFAGKWLLTIFVAVAAFALAAQALALVLAALALLVIALCLASMPVHIFTIWHKRQPRIPVHADWNAIPIEEIIHNWWQTFFNLS